MVPGDLFYTKDHEWVRFEAGDVAVIGITDHAQESLGDITFVEMPNPGRKLEAGDTCVVLESVKAASDVYAPVAGEVAEVNEALAHEPERINRDPYGDGWLCCLAGCDRGAVGNLMTAAQYEEYLASA